MRGPIIILTFALVGEVFNKVLHIPLPAGVIGMLLLLMALVFKVVKLESIEKSTDFLLKNLALFFIPAGVGLMTVAGLIMGIWPLILVITVVSTLFVMAITGFVVQLLAKGGSR